MFSAQSEKFLVDARFNGPYTALQNFISCLGVPAGIRNAVLGFDVSRPVFDGVHRSAKLGLPRRQVPSPELAAADSPPNGLAGLEKHGHCLAVLGSCGLGYRQGGWNETTVAYHVACPAGLPRRALMSAAPRWRECVADPCNVRGSLWPGRGVVSPEAVRMVQSHVHSALAAVVDARNRGCRRAGGDSRLA